MDPTQLSVFPPLQRYDEPNYPIFPNHMPQIPSLHESEEESAIDANMPRRSQPLASNQGAKKKRLASNSVTSSSENCDESSASDIAHDVHPDDLLTKLNFSSTIELKSEEQNILLKFKGDEEICRMLVRVKITTKCVVYKKD
eukprot:GHVP01067351.1.p1 GENE.GHVP01067351.1~~GHVP01067351.1.p1  ORF type:complete len:142 (+),score=30.32 GHVP01067351.1:234-659(+)